MEKYDVVIIGGGLASLATATYLSKRLRNIAVFEDGDKAKLSLYANRFRDEDLTPFNFATYHYDFGSVHKGDLLSSYLSACGLENKFDFIDNNYAMVVDQDRQLVKRPNDAHNFKTYLVRHYPKNRNAIYRFFDDIYRHYDNYHKQKLARLKNEEYTISSLLIEWGDLSLYDVLNKYFDHERLIMEFSLVYDTIGLDLKKVNAYNYFIKWLDTFVDGAHFVTTTFDDIVKIFNKEISRTKDNIHYNRSIKAVKMDGDKIDLLIDQDDNEIKAKHYVINMRNDEFFKKYLPDREDLIDSFYEVYPDIQSKTYVNQAFFGFDTPVEELGITNKQYLFSDVEKDEIRFLSVLNYKMIYSKVCKDGKGAILVEFLDVDDCDEETLLTNIMTQLENYFPGLKGHYTLKRIGRKRPYFGSHASDAFWEDKNINDLFNIDDYSYVNQLDNAYFIGSWVKQEAGITGMIQLGVEYGDIIDDRLYHGEDDDYFINHAELMNIIAHQFIPYSLGKKEKNIQFFIGKDSFYIRTKGKHQRLFKGVSDISDIIIIATNECLYDLSVGNISLEKVLEQESFEFVGDEDLLQEVIEGFDMGIEISKPSRYDFVQGKWGIKLLLLQFAILGFSNLLANYHNYLIIAPITAGLFGAIMYFKYKKLGKTSVFEIVIVAMYLLITVFSLFIGFINTMQDSSFTLAFISIYLLATWLFNFPVSFNYIRHDYREDYTRTKLFEKMNGGLTFIWGVNFLILTIASFTLDTSYSSLLYYVNFLAMYLSFYYPASYIRGYID
ncbi:MAG: NAD(P)-binding protein [Candidatus Izimaplasma sp.]|nr:NAD(P)-binding protein [Candidatus Izimaplasma bacterium]